MKLIIAGSRSFNDRNLLFRTVDNLREKYHISEIVSGTARGADSFGEEYGFENSIKVTEFSAEWDRYGKSAGVYRNKQMGDYADICICFYDGGSPGTKNMISVMKKLMKPCFVEMYNEDEDEW